MFSSFRDRFGTAGLVVAIMALVIALAGTAYAASKLNSTQKKEVEKIAKKYAGKPGAPGAQGAKGDTGAPGSSGSNGTNGTNGKDGATGLQGKQGEQGPQGKPGDPWTAGGTLPEGATETGAWAIRSQTALTAQTTGLSFTIPLESALGEEEVHIWYEADFATSCTGSIAEPTAPSGELCVYGDEAGSELLHVESLSDPSTKEKGASTSGAILSEILKGIMEGTWAVTG